VNIPNQNLLLVSHKSVRVKHGDESCTHVILSTAIGRRVAPHILLRSQRVFSHSQREARDVAALSCAHDAFQNCSITQVSSLNLLPLASACRFRCKCAASRDSMLLLLTGSAGTRTDKGVYTRADTQSSLSTISLFAMTLHVLTFTAAFICTLHDDAVRATAMRFESSPLQPRCEFQIVPFVGETELALVGHNTAKATCAGDSPT
jgi:hypothetical protein